MRIRPSSVSGTWILGVGDLCLFFVISVVPTTLFVLSRHAATAAIVMVSTLLLGRLVSTAARARPVIEPNWLNWFEVSKLIGGLAGVLYVTIFRGPEKRPVAVFLLLAANMAEAVLSDLQRGLSQSPNALAGCLAMQGLWQRLQQISPETTASLAEEGGWAVHDLPLSPWWIILYSSWNAAFSYGYGFSWSTRFQLVTAVVVSHVVLQRPGSWLSARCYSMVLNMCYRSKQFTRVFVPGETFLTDGPIGGQRRSRSICLAWGIANCILATCLVVQPV